MYHKQSTSARTRFLALSYGGVCAFDVLPKLSNIIEQDDEPTGPVGDIAPHPAMVIAEAERKLCIPAGSLESDADFRVAVDTPGSPIEIYLAHFTDIDPPSSCAWPGRCYRMKLKARTSKPSSTASSLPTTAAYA